MEAHGHCLGWHMCIYTNHIGLVSAEKKEEKRIFYLHKPVKVIHTKIKGEFFVVVFD